MAAHVLGAVALGLLLCALFAALGPQAQLVSAPVFFQRSSAVGRRGNRLKLERHRAAFARARAHVEQLNGSRSQLLSFTHVVVDLGKGSWRPLAHPKVHASDDVDGAASLLKISPDTARAPAPRKIVFRAGQPAPQKNLQTAGGAVPAGVTIVSRGQPINVTLVSSRTAKPGLRRHTIVAGPGDTLRQILRALGMRMADILQITSLFAGRRGRREAFAGGEKVIVLEREDPHKARYIRPLKVSIERPHAPIVAFALSAAGRYVWAIPTKPRPLAKTGHLGAKRFGAKRSTFSHRTLRASLYAMAAKDHIAASLVAKVIKLFAHEVDFDTHVSKKDKADLLYSSDARGRPRLVYAALTVGGKTHRYYRFTPHDDHGTDYFDPHGHSEPKFLMRKPVPGGRLNDGFGWRVHPILRKWLFHEGVDYDAPYGSPIVAAGDGVVVEISRQWGYGKFIRLRHDYGYETTYAHVSGFPHGLKVGDHVHQGETIAYIGSSGLSTGPHLYYEVRVDGRDVNPLHVHLPAGRILAGKPLKRFEHLRHRIDVLLAASLPPRVRHRRSPAIAAVAELAHSKGAQRLCRHCRVRAAHTNTAHRDARWILASRYPDDMIFGPMR